MATRQGFLTAFCDYRPVFLHGNSALTLLHESEPEGIPPQDFLRPGDRRARWLLRGGAVQRQSAVQRVAKICRISERGPSLALVEHPLSLQHVQTETDRDRYARIEKYQDAGGNRVHVGS